MDIPVHLIKRPGTFPNDLAHSAPCVEMQIRNSPGSDPVTVMALIDTGADGIYVDEGIVAELSAPTLAVEPVHSANHIGSGTKHAGIFLVLPSLHFQSLYLSSPLRASGRNYDAVLGRSIFTMVDLLVKDEVFHLRHRQAF